MTVYDHIIIVLLVFGVPLYERFHGIARMRRAMAADRPNSRRRLYWQETGIEWAVTAIVVGLWLAFHRSLADLGLGVPGGTLFWIGLVVAAGVAGAMTAMQRAQVRDDDRRRKVLEAVMRAIPFAPRNNRELGHFIVLSITAGICEETIYRGYMIWYAAHFTGTGGNGLALAVLLTSAVFAIGHIYQGARGVMQVFVIGVILGLVYITTGSLWVPIALHAYLDVNGGIFAVYLHRSVPPAGDDHDERNPDASGEPVTLPEAAGHAS